MHTLEPTEAETISCCNGIIQGLELHKPKVPFYLDPFQSAIGRKMLFQVPFLCSFWIKIHHKKCVCGRAVLPAFLLAPLCFTISLAHASCSM